MLYTRPRSVAAVALPLCCALNHVVGALSVAIRASGSESANEGQIVTVGRHSKKKKDVPMKAWQPDVWPPPVPHDRRFLAFRDRYPMARGDGKFAAMFDWYVGNPKASGSHKMPGDPRTVFARANQESIAILIQKLEACCNSSQKDRYVYFSGDMRLRLVNASTIAQLQRLFKGGIFYQARDVDVPGFTTAPVGLNEYYFRRTWDSAERAIAAAGVDDVAKPKVALAAWGYMRKLPGIPSRQQLEKWVATPEAKACGVERRMIEWSKYWGELSKYRFLLAPNGGGILSPKTDEALLVLTVPIMVRDAAINGPSTFDDWVKLGWPIVVLDEWSEITASKLDSWWTSLSPRLVSFRKNCMSTEGFYKIVTGQVKRCE